MNTNIHNDLGFIDALAHEKEEDPFTHTEIQKTEYMEQGRDRMLGIQMLMGTDQE